MPDVLTVPPFRTPLLTANGKPLSSLGGTNGSDSTSGPQDRIPIETTREWWIFWRTIAELANSGVSMITFGFHTDRPKADGMPNGAIYVDQERNVLYQNQDAEWHYIAGTMWGTLSPDQRPTDLGVNDAGFDFRTIDSNPVYAQREFIWSGSAWIETTLIQYGTHAARPAAAAFPLRGLYIETDRGNVIYEQQAGTFVYCAGMMAGTLSPDQRPAGLGAADTGFLFFCTDTKQTFRWSGSAWVDTAPPATPQNTGQIAYATAGLILTTTAQPVAGCSLTLARAGVYLINGVFDFNTSLDANQVMLGTLSGQAKFAIFVPSAATGRATVSMQWQIIASAGTVVNLVANKTGGTGGSQVDLHTCISAVWISP